MNLPDQIYSKAFWEAVTTFLAGALGLLAFLGYVDSSWAVPATVMLAWIYSMLRLFGIEPELKLKALEAKLRRAEEFLKEAAVIRNDLLNKAGQTSAKVPAKRK